MTSTPHRTRSLSQDTPPARGRRHRQGAVSQDKDQRQEKEQNDDQQELWQDASEYIPNRTGSLRERWLSVDMDDLGVPSSYEVPLDHQGPPEDETTLSFWEERLDDLFTIIRLAFKLYSYLFVGIVWYINFLRLVAFTILLLPGFAQFVLFYFFSPRLLRSVPFHPKHAPVPRNRLDVYLPRRKFRKQGRCPVVIYVTGGAWTIGYKAWGCALGRRLSQRGLLVFCLDYRNFPQGLVMDMLEDVNRGINWVFHNCHLYGGDADNIFLVGQSAGGHLTSLVLLAQAMRQAKEHRTHAQVKYRDSVVAGERSGAGDAANISQTVGLAAAPNWDPRRIRGFVGVSGAYNLVSLTGHLHKRGLYQSMFEAMMSGPEGTPMMKELSPSLVASTLPPHVAEIVPKMLLLHGTGDKSVPIQNAEEFCAALRAAGVRCVLKTYLNKTHTQPIIEDPMRGGRDELMDEVLGLVRGKPCYNKQFPMQPSILIDAATWICPF